MNEMSPIPQRIKELRERAGLSVRAMAEAAGMGSSSYAHYEHRFKKSFLPADVAETFASALEPYGIPRHEVMVLAGIEAAAAMPAVIDPSVVMVPVLDIAASAGPGAYVDYEMQVAQLSLPREYLRGLTSTGPEKLAIISVKGDSMEPTLKDGDIVLVDGAKTSWGFDGLFVLDIDGTLHVKRLSRSAAQGKVQVLSDNRLYPPLEYDVSDVRVVGKVRWRGGALG